MPRRLTSTYALSPVLLMVTAAMLSVGAVADGAAAAMVSGGAPGHGGGDQQALTQFAEAIVATAGAICDEDGGAMPMPVAVVEGPLALGLEVADDLVLAPLQGQTPRVRSLRSTLTNLPPPVA